MIIQTNFAWEIVSSWNDSSASAIEDLRNPRKFFNFTHYGKSLNYRIERIDYSNGETLLVASHFSVVKLLFLGSGTTRLESMKEGTGGFITMADKIYAHLIKSQNVRRRGRILRRISWQISVDLVARVKWELKTLTRTNNWKLGAW